MKTYSQKFLFLFLSLFFIAGTSFAQNRSEIVGSWSDSNVGPTNYENQTTGALKNGRGSSFTYKFLANGTFEYIGYMEVTTYNCTTILFNNKVGKYSVNGSTVTLKPTKDYWKNTNSCAPSSNKQQNKTPVDEELQWQVRQNDNGKTVLALDKGKGEMVFRREEK